MPSILKICAYFLATLVLGAALAPLLFWAGQASGIEFLQLTDFQRYFDRAMFLAALLLLWPSGYWLNIRDWSDCGLRQTHHGKRRALAGFLLAGGLFWAMGAIGLRTGHYRLHPQELAEWSIWRGFIVTAIAVAALEEAFFRGALFCLSLRSAPPLVALVFVASIYAILHFLKPSLADVPGESVTWASGFIELPRTFWQFTRPGLLVCGFTTLFLAGLILGWARLQTGSLWPGFGLHAGWIFGLKSFSKFTRRIGDTWPWFGDNLLIGIGPVLSLILTGSLVWLWLRRCPAPAGEKAVA